MSVCVTNWRKVSPDLGQNKKKLGKIMASPLTSSHLVKKFWSGHSQNGKLGPNRFLILLHFWFFRVPGFMQRIAKWFECKANSFKLYPLSLKFASFCQMIIYISDIIYYIVIKSQASTLPSWWCLTVDKSCLNFVKGLFVDTQEKCFIFLRCLFYCEE